VYLCVVWISEQTAIIPQYNINCLIFVTETKCVYRAVRTGSLTIIPPKPSGRYMYHQFNIQQSYVLPTQSIYMFYMDLRTNSDNSPIQR